MSFCNPPPPQSHGVFLLDAWAGSLKYLNIHKVKIYLAFDNLIQDFSYQLIGPSLTVIYVDVQNLFTQRHTFFLLHYLKYWFIALINSPPKSIHWRVVGRCTTGCEVYPLTAQEVGEGGGWAEKTLMHQLACHRNTACTLYIFNITLYMSVYSVHVKLWVHFTQLTTLTH